MNKTSAGKVVLINQNAGYLTIDIANTFAENYAEVVLIAGLVKPMERSLSPYVKVYPMCKFSRDSTFKRLRSWIVGSLQIFFAVSRKFRNYEVIYFTNPPFAYLSALLLKNRFSIVVYDTYPDALKTIGISERNPIFRIWAYLNRKVFARAEKLITLSDGMAIQLKTYINASRIRVVPNWAGSENFKPIPKLENPFAIENNLQEQFVVMYSGNMGYTHSVEVLIELASELKQEREITFLLVGEGKKKEQLMEMCKKLKLDNVVFKTWQPAEILPWSLAVADISVVTLEKEIGALSVPSKTYNILAVGSPMLCVAPDNSELTRLINDYQFGKCFRKEDLAGMKDFVLKLHQEKSLQATYSSNALKASGHFTMRNAWKYI